MNFEVSGKRLMRAWAAIATQHAALVLSLAVVTIALLGAYAARELGISTETENMIDETLEWRQHFIDFRDEFPQHDRTIVIVVSAETQAAAQRATVHLSRSLNAMPAHVASQYSPTVHPPVAGRELLLLDAAELEQLADGLAAAQPFIGALRKDYSISALLDLLGKAAAQDRLDVADMVWRRLGDIITSTLGGKNEVLDWSSLSAQPHRLPRRLIIVKPVLDSGVPRPARRVMNALQAAGKRTTAAFDTDVRVGLTGLVALEDEELVSVTRNARNTGLLALGSVIIILMFAFRSVRLLVISVVTLLAGLIGTAAFAAWSVGDLNIISVAFAVLYIGLGIDFVIHYLLRFREASAEGLAVNEALQHAGEDVGISLFICTVTTAAGFFAFVPTSFTGVSQLGLVSGTGMFISLVATLTLLPALIRLSFPHGIRVSAGAAVWEPGRWMSKLLVYRRTILVIPLLLVCAALLNLERVRFESDPMLLRDPGSPSVQVFDELESDPDLALSAISVMVAGGDDVEAVKSELEALPTVDRALSLDDFDTRGMGEKLITLDDIVLMLGPSFDRFPPIAAIDLDEARRELAELLRVMIADGTDQSAARQEFSTALASLVTTLRKASLLRQEALLRQLQHNWLSDLPGAMKLLSDRLDAQPIGPDRFPQAFVARWLGEGGTQLIRVVPGVDIADPENARRFVTQVKSVAPQATGMPVVYHESGETVSNAFGQALLTAAVTISILMYVLLRSVRDTVTILVPLGIAAVLIAGVMIVAGIPFNFANIIALPLLLGISVDTGIHLVHRAHSLPGNGAGLLETSTSRAILFSSVTTLASFGNLAVSSHMGMASMGLLLSAGLLVMLAVMFFILPVLVDEAPG